MPSATKNFLGALLLVASSGQVSAFAPGPSSGPQSPLVLSMNRDQINENQSLGSSVESSVSSLSMEQLQNRRDALRNAFSVAIAGTTAVAMGMGEPANAAAVPTAAELEKLRKGHARVQYLLQNWEDITEVCKNNSDQATKQVVRTDGGDKCEKTPLNVQIYMGYKSTEDPLYKADKLMVRAASLVKDDFDQADYLEAVENYKEKADNTAMMAYTSSWGEANPNGGKDVIDDYLEKTRLDVVSSEKSLRLVLKYLGLEPLPASENPQ
eukprot:CAMPEP_0116132596 /NCGR_PEP_ID=MMETSP0329-20121206/9637_1 /TAXON_ID=697910 /ORGANISM="Pseudo-nitzschia arenysensis, Strain B593" /LENGTH=266 /DNA_ID=CAMNT_0003627131 /DNA_START=27 /DNA_END=827 /DNA_ORIENTATION=-